MTGLVRRFLLFWYDFLIGDCWQIAAGVVAALAVCAGLVAAAPGLDAALGPALALLIVGVVSGAVWLEVRRQGRSSPLRAPRRPGP